MSFLFVALGGAVGAMARYAISLIPVKTGFPILTLATNIFQDLVERGQRIVRLVHDGGSGISILNGGHIFQLASAMGDAPVLKV